MNCECEYHQGSLRLRGELTIYSAAAMKDCVLKELKRRRRKSQLDLSGVTEIDTAGVQILLLARRLCEASGGQFALLNPSAAAREALELCGLAGLIVDTTTERAS